MSYAEQVRARQRVEVLDEPSMVALGELAVRMKEVQDERDEALRRAEGTEEELEEKKGEVTKLEARVEELEAQVSKLEARIEEAKDEGFERGL